MRRLQHRKRRASRIPELNRSYDQISISTIQNDTVVDSNHNIGMDNKAFIPDTPKAILASNLSTIPKDHDTSKTSTVGNKTSPVTTTETPKTTPHKTQLASMSEEERAAINNLNELIASCENLPEDYSSGTKKEEVFTEDVMIPDTKPSSNGSVMKQSHENGDIVTRKSSNGDVMSSKRSSENPPDVIPQTVVTHADVH